MEEQNSKSLLSVVLAVIITAVVVGGGMYWWQTLQEPQSTTADEAEIVEETSAEQEEVESAAASNQVAEDNCEQSGGAYSNEEQVTRVADSVFIFDIFSKDESWQTYTNQEGDISFEYPKNLFTPRTSLFEPASGLTFTSGSKKDWDSAHGEELDGYCAALGDPDCGPLWNWHEGYELYQEAINGNKKFIFGYEYLLVKQQTKKIGEITFLTGVQLGVNGGCSLDYVTYQNDTKLHFRADICDDEFFQKYLQENLDYGNYLNNEGLVQWATNILNGTPDDLSTTIKQDAIEKILNNITIK